jgi:mRNA interferase MazF
MKDNTRCIKVSRGDIFYADLAGAIGSEQGGIRPVLVLQNNVGNLYSPTIIAAPITGKKKRLDLPTHVDLGKSFGLTKASVVMLEQLRTLDKVRLGRYVGTVDEAAMKQIDYAYGASIGQFPIVRKKGGLHE